MLRAKNEQNHLDMETIDALITAIQDYKGGVIVVSHDLHFLRYTINMSDKLS